MRFGGGHPWGGSRRTRLVPSSAARTALIWALRIGGTAAGVIYTLSLVDLDKVDDAVALIPIDAFAIAIALVAANVVAGALRWRVLLDAYGATAPPPMSRLVYLSFVGFFYNNYLPGAVAGDVVRGVATREAFGEHGLTGNLAVVLVERALGLFALFALLAAGLGLAGGDLDTGSLWLWTAIGCAGAAAIVVGLVIARRIAPRLPGALGRIAGRVPAIVDNGAFARGVLLSVATQSFIALAGWVLLHGIHPEVDLASALLVVPLAAATTFLPITVGGAGAREAVFISLCGKLFAMPGEHAFAASLALWGAHLAVGAAGGVLVALRGTR
jgi:glycosyltransferase 2 family protein